ncbi:bifunctional 3-deoxy-7-phosphoheptulonate synthase/chorismate mutase type II [Marinigracilibium pacificum]|uniref:chorismate mutase n=1 Tax=Marinigracilibium pacificum TaxID=2729599 RepID=A0A848J4J4_9BACT|nr:bifunctional 3-deoxy-7-phosphoheptulonate synthase/chorismate mutase type II [Marinigracilibium pacificum]NMM49394.1 bifunctional 3-deoxy-7-phosphoheptulonate synthase/chorismate mutase type II [Marinigracilibium pacificum]
MNIKPIDTWSSEIPRPLIISGPCSAETEEQLLDTCKRIKDIGINIMRAGVWKPRTRPNSFEGIGTEALQWIQNVKKELDVEFAIEVANPQHVDEALKHGIDILWIGARSTVNPFTVQDIADSLKGVDIPVLIKNPINPDLALWQGAIERVFGAGINRIGAIHRGFSSFQKTKFRNEPMWQLPIELKRLMPGIPIIGDPSHIAGDREMIYDLSQKMLDLGYDGLMIETHRDPVNAWSDAKQQVSPYMLKEIVKDLNARISNTDDELFTNRLEDIRSRIDQADRELLEVIATRMKLVEQIGEYKKDNNVAIFQVQRWDEVYNTREEWGRALGMDSEFVNKLISLLHDESIKTQTQIMNKNHKKA